MTRTHLRLHLKLGFSFPQKGSKEAKMAFGRAVALVREKLELSIFSHEQKCLLSLGELTNMTTSVKIAYVWLPSGQYSCDSIRQILQNGESGPSAIA